MYPAHPMESQGPSDERRRQVNPVWSRLRLTDRRIRDYIRGAPQGAGENLFPVDARLTGHAAITKRLVAQSQQGIERSLFESGFPVIRRAAGLVVVDPFAIRGRPAGAKQYVTPRDIEDIAGAQ